ncbi:uncharacterized protein BXZ73DRAFT_97560 [Epithele typhae]|uniref:uncharacterized protein n=1 Tax=Epithele typhae TaxID=378194 RepID=UPI00200778E1|nr:uncharacterized protein BXZ73DRAFT_97560 [Epithele typhae]KAH9942135.1 hypothetical protein BXZ73DRAFT_97560 [Epithele typhae]
MNSTHRAFSIPEIFLMIMDRVVPEKFDPGRRHMLWEILPSLKPLLKLLPSVVLDSEKNIHTVQGEVSSEDKDRFIASARLVRELTFKEQDHTTLPQDVWDHIESLTGGKPILPSLRNLFFTAGSVDNLDVVRLVGPLTDNLELRYFDDDGFRKDSEAPANLVNEIVARTKNLTHITLFSMGDDMIPESFFEPMVTLPKLRYIMIEQGWVSLEVFRLLATFPALADLTADFLLEFEETEIPLGFEHLESLYSIDISNDGGLSPAKSKVITSCASPHLRVLRMGDDTAHSATTTLNEWRALCVLVAERFRALEHFSWAISHTALPLADPTPAAHAFEPLLTLRALRRVELDFGTRGVRLDDALFAAAARAWPHLEHLTLCGPRRPPRTSTRTRRARAGGGGGGGGGGGDGDLLELLARVRPGAVPDVPLMAHELHRLQFDCAPDPGAANALAAAFALDRMFPELSEVGPAYVVLESHDGRERPGGGEDAQQEFWDDVCFGLEFCETARRNRGERKMRRIVRLDG